MDYLMRDSRYTGAAYGQINPLIIIRGSKLIDNKICFRTKILCEIENMLIGRFHMYAQVYNNAKGIANDFVIQSIFKRVKYLYLHHYKFVDKYSLLQMFKAYLESRKFTFQEILKLDDSIFFTFLESIQYEKDKVLLSLYKAYHNSSLITIKKATKNTKVKGEGDEIYFNGIMSCKNVAIYHKNKDPIYMFDEDNNKPIELSKVSTVINRLSSFEIKQKYVIKIKH
ncbi:MAG: hypothetical protein HUJ68_06495 [Clostridia bacterium]|nr:hypothetical protein [Clostridia bacterium]